MEARKSLAVAFMLAAAVAAGCSTARKHPVPTPTPTPNPVATEAVAPTSTPTATPAGEVYGPQEAFGPPIPPPASPIPAYGPEPIQLRAVHLVLGPGGARGFAHIGVLRALSEAKIPIAAIYGTEMGALVGAVYSYSGGKLNQFEWSLAKFTEDAFVDKKSILSFDRNGSSKKLEEILGKTLGTKQLKEAAVPLRIGLLLEEKDRPVMATEGVAAEALRAALAPPGRDTGATWEGSKAVSAAVARPFLLTEARSQGSPVVVVDTRPGNAASAPELKDADLVIRPDLKGIAAGDYQKRSEAAFRGKSAVNQNLKELRRLVGLPENGSGKP